MARGVFSVPFQAVAVTAAQDLFYLATDASTIIEVMSIFVSQSSDFGDAQDELLRVRFRSGMTTVGSGGSSVTPAVVAIGGTAAAGVTARVNDTTASSGGTIVDAYEDCFNVRAGWPYVPPPEIRFVIPVSTKFAVNLPSAPADSLTMSGTLIYRTFA